MYRRLAVVEIQLEELGLTHRKNQAMLLRRLAQNRDISALQTLVSVIEPVKEYRRYQLRPQTMLSPLTGLIDAARPDAEGARKFNRAVEDFLAGRDAAGNAEMIRGMLAGWREQQADLQNVMESSPALAEARQLSKDFQSLTEIAWEAFDALEKKSPKTSEWREARSSALTEIAKPKAALELMIVESVRKLVAAASEK
jgi:hexosaminidase